MSAALIPYTEFREKEVSEKYEINLDVDVLDSLDTAKRQKHVRARIP